MNRIKHLLNWPARLGAGLIFGAAIAVVDNFAFEGEVSPMFIVIMLLAASFVIGVIWNWRGIIATAAVWICIPLPHLIKHLLSLPDTLHPNTYFSIFLLAVFSFAIVCIGTGCGLLVHRLTKGIRDL